ncbi:hypothetical protein DL98DRAFT_501354, partial [Cadophora sp. DSE1049]
MTRWHKDICATPEILVDADGKTPRCRSCGSIAAVDEITAKHVAEQSAAEIPPDEPIGQMALWWPPSVRYLSRHWVDSDASEPGPDANKSTQDGLINLTRSMKVSPSTPDAIYGTTLSAEEFRLARFDALEDGLGPEYPIHIALEVFRLDDCPEYETVSYTWGGEDDDSRPCRPLFIGPYWDVLLQTRNCWDMLCYLRPRQGIRMVWIDAVCINQSDLVERALQVTSMRSVYQGCSRVVVYLGADLVSGSGTFKGVKRTHPSRHGLHEFDKVMADEDVDDNDTITLADVISRRYFSRVWIIQELLLSRSAVIPIAGREFWANGLTSRAYRILKEQDSPLGQGNWDWSSTTTPWMRDLCAGSLNTSISLYDVFRRTWNCRATDPRDKVFGVLGLVEPLDVSVTPAHAPIDSRSSVITPDYNISIRHTYIGIFAHTLISFGVTDVLVGAAGLSAPPNHLSWLPDWRRPEW